MYLNYIIKIHIVQYTCMYIYNVYVHMCLQSKNVEMYMYMYTYVHVSVTK